MNFLPMCPECAFESLNEVVDRGQQICNWQFAGNTVKIIELNQIDSGISTVYVAMIGFGFFTDW